MHGHCIFDVVVSKLQSVVICSLATTRGETKVAETPKKQVGLCAPMELACSLATRAETMVMVTPKEEVGPCTPTQLVIHV